MANQIYLPKKIAEDKEVIRVDGECYYKVGPSPEVPDHFDVEQVYVDCVSCEDDTSSSSSSSSGEPCDPSCMEYVAPIPPASTGATSMEIELVSCNWIGDDQICSGDPLDVEFKITNTSPFAPVTIRGVLAPKLAVTGFDFNFVSANPTNVNTTSMSIVWPDLIILGPGQSRTFTASATLNATNCPGGSNQTLIVSAEKVKTGIQLQCKNCPPV